MTIEVTTTLAMAVGTEPRIFFHHESSEQPATPLVDRTARDMGAVVAVIFLTVQRWWHSSENGRTFYRPSERTVGRATLSATPVGHPPTYKRKRKKYHQLLHKGTQRKPGKRRAVLKSVVFKRDGANMGAPGTGNVKPFYVCKKSSYLMKIRYHEPST